MRFPSLTIMAFGLLAILTFGLRLSGVLRESVALRYRNVELIEEEDTRELKTDLL